MSTNAAIDVIHVQEDFGYHKTLYKNDNHTFRTKTSGNVLPIFGGSGLNTLSNFDFTEFDRITWKSCASNEGDCLTPKGFTYMRMSVAEGVTIDLYNIHAEAGNHRLDLKARRSNMKQLAKYMKSASAGQAVIVFGDTNSLYSRKEDNIRILGLSDAWVENHYGGVIPTNAPYCHDGPTDPVDEDKKCEALDKVLYKSGSDVSLNATSHAYVTERFLQENGDRLSDHNPVSVDFLWST